MSPFDFNDYKEFLRNIIESSQQRGLTSRLADAAHCQRPYLSKVLQIDSNVHLLRDHIFGISEYLGLNQKEENFLLLLLEKDRATQFKYRQAVENQIKEIQTQYFKVENQIKRESVDIQHTDLNVHYYSYWLYPALHIATSIPELQTLEALSQRFYFPQLVILQYLEQLEKMKLIKNEKNRWIWISGDIHLTGDSFWSTQNHTIWRQNAIQNIAQKNKDSVHFSIVQSLSKSDFQVLRMKMIELIKSFESIASPSKPEELITFLLDFYKT